MRKKDFSATAIAIATLLAINADWLLAQRPSSAVSSQAIGGLDDCVHNLQEINQQNHASFEGYPLTYCEPIDGCMLCPYICHGQYKICITALDEELNLHTCMEETTAASDMTACDCCNSDSLRPGCD